MSKCERERGEQANRARERERQRQTQTEAETHECQYRERQHKMESAFFFSFFFFFFFFLFLFYLFIIYSQGFLLYLFIYQTEVPRHMIVSSRTSSLCFDETKAFPCNPFQVRMLLYSHPRRTGRGIRTWPNHKPFTTRTSSQTE